MYKRILVPVDASPASRAGLDQAIRLAELTGGELRLVHVLDAAAHASGYETAAVYCNEVVPRMKQAGARVLDACKERCQRSGVKAEGLLLETLANRVCDLVVAHARDWGAELIVIGTHGWRGADRLMRGSDAEQIVRLSPVPVLLVRAPEERALDGALDPPGARRRTAWPLRPQSGS
jgi:nucleotide-binding universal stress UspA family protein